MADNKTGDLVSIACGIAKQTPGFQKVLGPGAGDRSTHRFMKSLREEAQEAFGEDFSEKRICGDNSFAVDFYIPSEGTVIEVALGLPNPNTELEKDILKALMAKEAGHDVRRLVFISRAGAKKKCEQPGRMAIREWAEERHGLLVEVHDLPGTPRRRARKGPPSAK